MESVLLQSLDELEGNVWGDPSGFVTPLIEKCHALRKIKLKDFRIEDLRLMIGQNISIEYLVPIAIDILKINPFAEGDFYEGDLLQNVLKCKCDFWHSNPICVRAMNEIIEKAKAGLGNVDNTDEINVSITEAMSTYQDCIKNPHWSKDFPVRTDKAGLDPK